MPATRPLRIPPLSKRKLAALTSKARALGMTAPRYVQLLIERDLALDHTARTTSFAELMGPGRDVDDALVDRLVDDARTRHHAGGRAGR